MSFLDAQNRLNASVMNRLKNCIATINGVDVPGIFMQPSQLAQLGVGMEDTWPGVRVFASDVPADVQDSQVAIDGTPYMVGRDLDSGTGFTLLLLEQTE